MFFTYFIIYKVTKKYVFYGKYNYKLTEFH